MGGTPPRTMPPSTPPHNIITTPPPQQGIPPPQPPPTAAVPSRHSPAPASTGPHIRTVAPPTVVTSQGLPPGLPRHPIPQSEAQAILHQGMMVRADVPIHPGMKLLLLSS